MSAKTSEAKITSATKLTFATPRPVKSEGPKSQLLALVPKKGSITVGKLREKAKAELELPAEQVDRWVSDFVRYGRVTVG